MKIKKEFSLHYDLDDITVVQTAPDGTEREICPISETAAMAWEGIDRGIGREELIDAIMTEFAGADRATVARDLDALTAQLKALGYIEE